MPNSLFNKASIQDGPLVPHILERLTCSAKRVRLVLTLSLPRKMKLYHTVMVAKSIVTARRREPSEGNPLKLYFIYLALKELHSSWKRSYLKMPFFF